MLLCTLFLIISSCSTTPHGWSSRRIETASSFTCNHLVFPPNNAFRNLEVVFQKDGSSINVFLNAYSTPFQKDSEGMTTVVLIIDEKPTTFKAPVLAGNQRILLPPYEKSLLLNALNEKKDIVIATGKYSAEVNLEAFEQEYTKFNSP